MKDASWKQTGKPRCPRRTFVNPEEDVPFFCLSYKHESDIKPLNADELMGALKKAAVLAESLYGKRCFRIWVDQLVFGSTQGWVGIGLVPYLLFPTVFASEAEKSTSSSWICMEKLCSQLIVGGDLSGCSGTELWKNVACSNTLLESISAVAEVVSKQEEDITTMRSDDLEYLHDWARGILYGKYDSSPYEGAREELGQPWNLAEHKKMHYIALFSLRANDNSVLRHYYRQRTHRFENGKDGWNIKHILFDANPKVENFALLEKVTIAVKAEGAENTLVLVTHFSNQSIYTRLNVLYQNDHKIWVSSMHTISEEQAEVYINLKGKGETVELERLY